VVKTILEFTISPVCAPAVNDGIADLAPHDAVLSQTLIYEEYDEWALWLAAAGIDSFKQPRRLGFRDYSMAVAAAVAGQGILFDYSSYIDTELQAGLLVRPFDLQVPIGKGYHLVYRKEWLADPHVRALRDGIMAEAAGALDPRGPSAQPFA
jgi:LysR family glycine cleavage system transcriptional activator